MRLEIVTRTNALCWGNFQWESLAVEHEYKISNIRIWDERSSESWAQQKLHRVEKKRQQQLAWLAQSLSPMMMSISFDSAFKGEANKRTISERSTEWTIVGFIFNSIIYAKFRASSSNLNDDLWDFMLCLFYEALFYVAVDISLSTHHKKNVGFTHHVDWNPTNRLELTNVKRDPCQ